MPVLLEAPDAPEFPLAEEALPLPEVLGRGELVPPLQQTPKPPSQVPLEVPLQLEEQVYPDAHSLPPVLPLKGLPVAGL